MPPPMPVPCAAPAPGRGPGTMRLRVSDLAQLFNSIDPSPFQERDLDPEADRFIVAWARDLPGCGPFALEVEVERPPSQACPEQELMEAVHAHFRRRSETTQRDLRALLRRGRISL